MANTHYEVHSPEIFGSVQASTYFTINNGPALTSRELRCSDAGTITVLTTDGRSQALQVFAGPNLIACKQVTNLGGLTIDWYA